MATARAWLLFHRLAIDKDRRFVAQCADASFVEVVVASLDREFGRKPDLLHAANRVFLPTFEDKSNLLGGAVHREVARHFVAAVDRLNAGALESDRWELLRVEKV